MDILIILQLCRSVSLHTSDFQVTKEIVKQQHYGKRKQISYCDIINIAECWCAIAFIYVGFVPNKL